MIRAEGRKRSVEMCKAIQALATAIIAGLLVLTYIELFGYDRWYQLRDRFVALWHHGF